METYHSSNRLRQLWHSFLLILVLYSAASTPFHVVFSKGGQLSGWLFFEYVIDIAFFIEIILNFFTPFDFMGRRISDRRRTISHYLRGWFSLDLLANVPWELLAFWIMGPSTVGLSTIALFRGFRLFRVLRLNSYFSAVSQLLHLRETMTKVIKLSLVCVLLFHGLACLWLTVVYIEGFPADSWATRRGLEGASSGFQYLHALYWTITTMTTVGYGDITPGTATEMIVAMITMALGVSLGLFLIGNISSLLANLNMAEAQFRQKTTLINEYMRYQGLPYTQQERVQNYFQYLWSRHRGLEFRDFMADLPEPLQMEIAASMMVDILKKVPLFTHASQELLNALVMKLEPVVYTPGDFIIREGDAGEEIYFINQGKVQIISEADGTVHLTLQDGDYFGDLALLFKEKRTASVEALSYCDLFVLKKSSFDEVLAEFPELSETLRHAAKDRIESASELVMKGIII